MSERRQRTADRQVIGDDEEAGDRHGEVQLTRHARELGFEIAAIRTLLTLQDDPNQPCATADGIAKARLIDVEQRIASLTALKVELEVMVEGCRHGRLAECRVIEVLADHGQCMHPHH